MTKQELEDEIKVLTATYENAVRRLKKDYIISNNPYKIGDIISDNISTIKIEKISLHFNGLCMAYEGVIVLKNGAIGKKIGIIYQSNIKK